MKNEVLRDFARVGARAELQRIYQMFPELLTELPTSPTAAVLPPNDNHHEPIETHHRIATAVLAEPTPTTPKRFMSAKQRKQISKRMKAYWRERRAAAAR